MEAPTLLMIHGIIGSLDYFDPQSRMPNLNVMTEDLLGFGQYTDTPARKLTLAGQAGHFARCIDEIPGENLWLLGHSLGGAVAILTADSRPDRVRGIINVEGNLTEKDLFWSRRIIAKEPDEWAAQYRAWVKDPASWLASAEIEPNSQRVAWADHLLTNQPASTLYHMAKALVDETLRPQYLETVRRLLDSELTMHLIAGERSADGWGVPDFVRSAAASYIEQPNVGHAMMLEAPDEFCRIVASILTD